MSTYKVELKEGNSIIVDALTFDAALALGTTFLMLKRPNKGGYGNINPKVSVASYDDVKTVQTFGRTKIITFDDLYKLSAYVNNTGDEEGRWKGPSVLSEIMKVPDPS